MAQPYNKRDKWGLFDRKTKKVVAKFRLKQTARDYRWKYENIYKTPLMLIPMDNLSQVIEKCDSGVVSDENWIVFGKRSTMNRRER